MSDQSKLGIGQIITTEQFKDAIHVAVAPVEAGEKLSPGEYVAIRKDGTAMGPTDVDKEVGIVDPFLRRPVKTGETFWLFLIPGSITSLRHQWSHPAFQDATEPVTAQETPSTISREEHIEKSKDWIKAHAEELGLADWTMMEHAETWLESEDYQVQRGSEHWRDSFQSTEFWHHYEVVTGKVVPEDKKHSFYCCSC